MPETGTLAVMGETATAVTAGFTVTETLLVTVRPAALRMLTSKVCAPAWASVATTVFAAFVPLRSKVAAGVAVHV